MQAGLIFCCHYSIVGMEGLIPIFGAAQAALCASRLGLRIVLGCKVDKFFLRAPLVFMEHWAPIDA